MVGAFAWIVEPLRVQTSVAYSRNVGEAAMGLQVSGFRFALNVILVGSVICGVILGGSSGAVMSFGSGWGIFIGAIVGGLMGWLTGAYAHGIGFTLLSIN